VIAFLKSAGIILGIFIGTTILAVVSPQIAFYVAIAFLILPGIALLKPIPKLWLGNRGVNFALILFVGIPVTIGAHGIVTDQRETQFAELKATDQTAYLAALEDFDQDRWLSELKVIDPERHVVEVARIAEEEAQKQQEARAKAQAEAAATRAEECGNKNEITAYVMSQEFVKRQLRAPSTAEFPWATEISTRALGDCKYQIVAYVDAQNAFGAMLRTRYTATMLLHPVEESWSALKVNVSE